MFLELIVGAVLLAHPQLRSGAASAKMDRDEFVQKDYRFINFNADDTGAVAVELAFNVPFLTIPTKKAVNVTKTALATVNVGSIVLAGAMVVGAGIAIPAIYHLLIGKGSAYSKAPRSDDVLWDRLDAKLRRVLDGEEMDSASCVRRVTCWVVKNSAVKVSKGIATSGDKILDGVASNEWFRTMIRDSILYHPVELGQNGGSCAREYANCKINHRRLQGFLKEVIKKLNF